MLKIFIFLMSGNATLNKGFAYLGVYPLFINEISFLLLFLFLLRRLGKLFLSESVFFFAILFLLFGLTKLVTVYYYDGSINDAFRNMAIFIGPAFYGIGYVLFRNREYASSYRLLNNWLTAIGVFVSLYYTLYPIRIELNLLTNMPWARTGLVGNYSTLYATAIGFMSFLFFKNNTILFYVGCIGFSAMIFFSQARGSIIGTVVVVTILIAANRNISKLKVRKFAHFLVFLMLVFFSFSVISQVEGQRGDISAEFLSNLVRSIYSDTGLSSLEGTKRDRIEWWISSINLTLRDPFTAMIGDSIDTVIVDIDTGKGGIIRYPHNSFVTIFRFSGFLGLFVYVFMLLAVVRKAYLLKNRTSTFQTFPINIFYWFILFYFGFLTASFFSTVLEAPFHSNLFWGLTGAVCGFGKSTYSPKKQSISTY